MDEFKPMAPAHRCNDGVTLSIQASRIHYCIPKRDTGPYSHVEVGFIRGPNRKPMAPPESWCEYAIGSEVWRDVPTKVVDEFIAAHGGPAFDWSSL